MGGSGRISHDDSMEALRAAPAARVRSRAPRNARHGPRIRAGVSAGARVTFAISGSHVVHLVPSGRVDHVSVIGFVVREGKTLQLRLADGSLLDAPRSSR